MDQKLNFSLSYELLLQEAEKSIQQCDLRVAGSYYIAELNKARHVLAFWHRLALKGKTGPADACFYERIEADWERLDALIRNESCAV